MKRSGRLVLVLGLVILAGVWAGTGPAATGPAAVKSGNSRPTATLGLICSIKDKCQFLRNLCYAQCRCLGRGRTCRARCDQKWRKCGRSFHTMDCWGAARLAKMRRKYLKVCPKKTRP
jgi:hypothetical protein